jgi:hypothetical protein
VCTEKKDELDQSGYRKLAEKQPKITKFGNEH